MALVSISEASRLTNKSRTTVHRYISKGKLSKNPLKSAGLHGTFYTLLHPANKPPLVAVVFLFASSRLRAEKKDLKKIL